MLGTPQLEEQRRLEQQPPEGEKPETEPSDKALIKAWQGKIRHARDTKFKKDFERMKDNMDFVAGIQWNGQQGIAYNKTVVNLTLQVVNHGVAMLYARNPKVEAKARKKLNYQIWDGNPQSIMMAKQLVQMASSPEGQMMGLQVPPDIMATVQDYDRGHLIEQQLKKVGETLEHVFQYQMDSQSPRFKLQMKQLVRRVRVCGVGYIRVYFCRKNQDAYDLTQSETRMSMLDRTNLAKGIAKKLEEGKIDQDSAEAGRLKMLVASLGLSPLDAEAAAVDEGLVFDFPAATSIIPDPNTRILKGFVGAKWVAEELYYPLDFVNETFGCDIKSGGEVKTFGDDKQIELPGLGDVPTMKNKKVRLWRVMDLEDKSEFILCDGYKDWVMPPTPVEPATKGFWNLFAVTLNDIEVEEDCKATIFPPSDVDLIKPMQKEWNRIREALRRHRVANGPKYLYPDGIVDEEDLDRVVQGEDQDFIKLKGLPPGADPGKIVVPLNVTPIQRELYDAEPLREDSLLATGQHEANIGPVEPNVTATGVSVAEQSRMSVAASDVDGFDDSLTEVVKCGGEMLLREMSLDTVQRIAGIGSVWPQQNRENFINEIELEVVAASSGRPNKAIEISNWGQIAPLLQAAGGNPFAIIKESIRRLDDRLDPSEFFLSLPTAMPQGPAQQQNNQPQSTKAPGRPNPQGARPGA